MFFILGALFGFFCNWAFVPGTPFFPIYFLVWVVAAYIVIEAIFSWKWPKGPHSRVVFFAAGMFLASLLAYPVM